MIIRLLLVTFGIAAAVSFFVSRLFDRPVAGILKRVVGEELSPAWQRYIRFAIYVVGISGGVRIWQLERYIAQGREGEPVVLNADRWALELYGTIVGTLQSIAWMLLVFFAFALVAYVVMRGFELKHGKGGA